MSLPRSITTILTLVALSAILTGCSVPVVTATSEPPQALATAPAFEATQTSESPLAAARTQVPEVTDTPEMTPVMPATTTDIPPQSAESTQTPTGHRKFTLGISNPFTGSEYRVQMLAETTEVNKGYMNAGLTNELVIESANVDVAGQIKQLQNLMAGGVDAILVYPVDAHGLEATLAEAVSKGILVIVVDQEANVPGVYSVGIDQKAWVTISAKWLAEKLGGKGEIVVLEGLPGSPANEARMQGVEEILAQYPGIKVLARETGKGDQATSQQLMSNFLAIYPTMTGYWTQDSMATGALQAVMDFNPAQWPQGVGEGSCQYLKLWQQALTLNPTFDSIVVANQPGVFPTALRIAVNLLMGKKAEAARLSGANGTSFVIPPAAVITKDNLADGLRMCEGKPYSYLLDKILTDDEVQQYFVK